MYSAWAYDAVQGKDMMTRFLLLRQVGIFRHWGRPVPLIFMERGPVHVIIEDVTSKEVMKALKKVAMESCIVRLWVNNSSSY